MSLSVQALAVSVSTTKIEVLVVKTTIVPRRALWKVRVVPGRPVQTAAAAALWFPAQAPVVSVEVLIWFHAAALTAVCAEIPQDTSAVSLQTLHAVISVAFRSNPQSTADAVFVPVVH